MWKALSHSRVGPNIRTTKKLRFTKFVAFRKRLVLQYIHQAWYVLWISFKSAFIPTNTSTINESTQIANHRSFFFLLLLLVIVFAWICLLLVMIYDCSRCLFRRHSSTGLCSSFLYNNKIHFLYLPSFFFLFFAELTYPRQTRKRPSIPAKALRHTHSSRLCRLYHRVERTDWAAQTAVCHEKSRPRKHWSHSHHVNRMHWSRPNTTSTFYLFGNFSWRRARLHRRFAITNFPNSGRDGPFAAGSLARFISFASSSSLSASRLLFPSITASC